ncbi:MAG: YraN family protein [Sphingomonadaceae bacterium]
MSGGRQNTGRLGEELAARYLEGKGYRVAARNYRCPVGELDLVVEGPEGLIFVEVRTKRQPCLVLPEETITTSKARRLAKLAEWYVTSHGQEERPWRVDLIAVELGPEGELVRLERFEDAVAGVVADGG